MLLDLYGMAPPPAAGLLLRSSAPSFASPPYPLLIFSGVSRSLLNLQPLAPVLFFSDLDRVGVRLQQKIMECPTRIGLGGHKKEGSSTACLPCLPAFSRRGSTWPLPCLSPSAPRSETSPRSSFLAPGSPATLSPLLGFDLMALPHPPRPRQIREAAARSGREWVSEEGRWWCSRCIGGHLLAGPSWRHWTR